MRKTIINRLLSAKEIVLAVHMILVKRRLMQKLHGMNIMIQLKVQSHRNTFKTIWTTVLKNY